MRADNSSAIVVFIEKKKMEPKNGGTAAYTEKWTSANKNEHKKEEIEERKPLKEMTQQPGTSDSPVTTAKSVIGRKRPSSENNNENSVSSASQAPQPTKKSKLTFTSTKVQRRRSTRIAVKRCEHGLTRSAARKRASL